MVELIGRNIERKYLLNALKSNKSELLVIYGRRRIGKTFLIRNTYFRYIKFELIGLHRGTTSDQLANFKKSLTKAMPRFERLPNPTNWLEAFSQLELYFDKQKSKKKKVIFIDEFPWMATPRSKFLMAFENFWNSYASVRDDLVVVICGSAASYMVKRIIRNKGGLHNRITQKIRLMPFSLKETEQYLASKNINYSRYDILQVYMAFGGIPYYLEKLVVGESVAQAIDRLCFAKDGFLTNEFDEVFASLYDNPEKHLTLIRALAGVRKGLTRNDLSKKSKLPTGGTLTKTLDELTESGFVAQYRPFGKKSKESLFRLADEYSMFYLKFVDANKGMGAGTWMKLFNQRSYAAWSGFSFETVCLKHIPQIKRALGISAIYSIDSSWVGKSADGGAQIDLLIDRDDNIINLCEMKFAQDQFTITKQYKDEIRSKILTFKRLTKTRKNVFVAMITTYGIRQNSHSLEVVQNSLMMVDLFKS